MKVYQVSYDLRGATQRDYQRLWRKLKQFKSYRIMKSTWLISTNKTAKELYSLLKIFVGAGRIFISEVNENRQGWMATGGWDMIKAVQPVSALR